MDRNVTGHKESSLRVVTMPMPPLPLGPTDVLTRMYRIGHLSCVSIVADIHQSVARTWTAGFGPTHQPLLAILRKQQRNALLRPTFG